MPRPIALTDAELALVNDVARPLRPQDRDAFMRALADELSRHPSIGPGLVHRIARDLQRTFFTPPNLNGVGRYD
jgi:hypothetical protein